jgi:hypothetical protein
MRHVATLIAAIVIGPLAWVMIAFGQERSAHAFTNAQSSSAAHPGDFIRPVLLLAAAGILLGLIATLRFSPLGAVLTGTVYAASYLALLIAPKRLLDLFEYDLSIAGRRADLSIPLRTGTALLLGALLLVAVVSKSRWRRWPLPAAESPETVPEGLGLLLKQDSTNEYATRPERTGTSGSNWSLLGGNPQDARR